jgi:hypothetical protein
MSPIPMPLAAAEHDDAKRWRHWERRYRNSSRRAAIQARIAFTILLTGSAAWLGLQIWTMPA